MDKKIMENALLHLAKAILCGIAYLFIAWMLILAISGSYVLLSLTIFLLSVFLALLCISELIHFSGGMMRSIR